MRAQALNARQRRIVAAAKLRDLLRRSGDALGLPARASVVVRVTDDSELQDLNLRFLDLDEPTDVLAFPSDEPGRIGDIAISVERAMEQAPSDASAELRVLAVHGLLHCLGHDHAEPAEAARMTAATARLLPDQVVPRL